MQFLGDVLCDRVALSIEAEPLDDRVREVFLEFADDDVGGTHVDLELDQLRTSQADDDDEPEAAAWWSLERCRGSRRLVAEVVAKIDREARRQ